MANYSNMEIFSAVNSKTNATYKMIFLRGYVSKPDGRFTNSGKFVLNTTVAINNRAKKINAALGTSFSEEKDNLVWARASFWEQTGQRLQKYMGDRKSVLVDIQGEVTTRTYTTRDGQEAVSVEIKAFDFWGLPSGDSQNNAQNAAQSQPQTGRNAAQNQNNDPFGELEDEDDTGLPF